MENFRSPGTKVPGTFVPGTFRSRELSFSGNESFLELSFPGPFVPRELSKVPGNEKSPERKFPIGTIRSWERKVLSTKSPGTDSKYALLPRIFYPMLGSLSRI